MRWQAAKAIRKYHEKSLVAGQFAVNGLYYYACVTGLMLELKATNRMRDVAMSLLGSVMSVYEFHQLKPELYLIVWCGFPTAMEGEKFLQELKDILDYAPQKVCFLSDLRRGYIKDTLQISKLSKLIAHPNCGPTTAFGSMGSQVFVGVTHRLLQRAQRNDFGWATLHDAVKYLEQMRPGITAGISWE